MADDARNRMKQRQFASEAGPDKHWSTFQLHLKHFLWVEFGRGLIIDNAPQNPPSKDAQVELRIGRV